MTHSLPTPLLREGREVLAVPLGVRRKEHVLRVFSGLRSETGYRVEGARVDPWHFEGFWNEADTLYLYGPAEKGRLLEEVIAGEGPPKPDGISGALPYLERLAGALARLEEAGVVLEHLQTDSVLFLDGDGVLFLPPSLMRRAGELRPGSHKLQVFETVNHPDWLPRPPGRAGAPPKGGTAHLSFTLGALCYRAILGEYPFGADSEEEVHNRTRHLQLAPPSLRVPELKTEAGRFILRALGRESETAPSLSDWARELSAWNRGGLFRPLDQEQREALVQRARAQGERAARAYRRRVFWQRKGLTVGIAAAVVAVVGILAGTYLRTLLAPRATLGFTPRQVVESYLQGLNTLDHTLMEDCTVEGAGKETIREVINIYVMSRVTQGYEGRSNVLPADEWDRMGRPALTPPETVFGVTDVEVREIRGEPEPVFEATYTRWVPAPGEEPAGGEGATAGAPPDASSPGGGEPGQVDTPYGPTVTARQVSERYFLRSHRNYWAIFRIEPG